MAKKKVIRIIARLNVGGPALHCMLLSQELSRFGFETVLVSGVTEDYEESYTELFQKKAEGFRWVQLGKLKRAPTYFGDLLTLFELIKIIRRERPDIVHTHTAKAGVLGRIAAIVCRVPVVVHTFHGHVLSGYFGRFISSVICWVERVLAMGSSAIITLSPKLADTLSGSFKVAPRSKFRIVPLGRSLEEFHGMPRKQGRLRRELGLPSEVRLVGTIGRLVPIKNQKLLLRACAELSSDCRVVVVGEGNLDEALKAEAESLGISDRVHFLGWRKDLPDLYSDFDVFTLTSLNEGTPLSIIESFAAGCPSVSTAVGGVADLYTPDQSVNLGQAGVSVQAEGVLVPSEDLPALVAALNYVLAGGPHIEAMEKASRRASQNFTAERLAERVAAVYNGLLPSTLISKTEEVPA